MKYEKGTFITVPNKNALRGLDTQSQALFVWLCAYADDEGQCFPSIKRLAKDCRTSRDTIIRRLAVLCDKGLLEKRARYNDGQQTSNLYQIMLVRVGAEEGGSREQPPQSHTATPRGSREQHRTQSNRTQSNELYTSKSEDFVDEDATEKLRANTRKRLLEAGIL